MRRRWFVVGATLAGCGPSPTEPRRLTTRGPRDISIESLFEDKLGNGFLLSRLDLWIDQALVLAWSAPEHPAEESVKDVALRGTPLLLAEGGHQAQAVAIYQGNGYGVFSYLKGYKFDVRSKHEFEVLRGQRPTLTATCYEKGGVTTPLEERPAIRWQLSTG